MALSDSRMKYMQSRSGGRRAVGAVKKRWSDSQKTEAVQMYMVMGSLKMVAAALQIPFDTMKVWKASEWWKTLEGELRVQEDLQLSARLTKIVNRSYDVIEDRMENGDFVYDQKSGKMRRKPVNMRDAHKVVMALRVKRVQLISRHIAGASVITD